MKDKAKEWSTEKKWNPFNSYKLLSQVYRWKYIDRKNNNNIPQPSLVTVDPINACNYKCEWCNANNILEKNSTKLSDKTLMDIADFLPRWQGSENWPRGVEAICVAGGGEPLMNKHTGKFIKKCIENKVEVGVVTNGSLIDKNLDALSRCTWVGVSVDCATPDTMKQIKGVDMFDKTMDNIKMLVDYSLEKATILSSSPQGFGVSYKYLLSPDNVHEVYDAAKLAKSLGCKNFHMRPVGLPWDQVDSKDVSWLTFSDSQLDDYNKQVDAARELEDENFGVFGITHKFDDKFKICNQFHDCHAIFMTGVFMPSNDRDLKDGFDFGLCCDRRGDNNLLLCKDATSCKEVKVAWGSEKHWEVYDKIEVNKCPRCTYQPHNQIYEHVIQADCMNYKFI